ncbi:MAG: hypothetical protein LKJ76_08635 [Lachnospiraceae bacterium]|nr:hypothetical protein [Lachnospiraceae bacterium]
MDKTRIIPEDGQTDGAEKHKLIIAVVLNLAAAVFSAVGTALSFQKNGMHMLAFYTVDSNIFAMLACFVYAAFLVRRLTCGKKAPAFAVMLKYTAVCCLTFTFLVVITVLAPMNGLQGYRMMLLSGEMLFHHLLSPGLTILSYLLFDRVPYAPGKAARCGLFPTIVYAAVIVLLNLMRIVTGPYPFLMVYRQPVGMSVLWSVLLLGGMYGLSWLIARLRQQRR